MRRLVFAAILSAIAFTPASRAQVLSIYGTYSPAHLTDAIYKSTFINPSNGGTSMQNTSAWTQGFNVGATVHLFTLGPVKLGLDLRGSPTKTGTPGVADFFAGIKANLNLPSTRLKPYVQVSGGLLYLRTTDTTTEVNAPTPGVTISFTTTGTAYQRVGAYEFIGGLDYRILRFVDLRVAEVGVGRAATSPFGANAESPDHVLLTVNTGVVAHF
jgi:hypothetical protein